MQRIVVIYGEVAKALATAEQQRYAAGVPGEGNPCNPRSALKAALLPLSE